MVIPLRKPVETFDSKALRNLSKSLVNSDNGTSDCLPSKVVFLFDCFISGRLDPLEFEKLSSKVAVNRPAGL